MNILLTTLISLVMTYEMPKTPVCKQRTRTCNQSGYYRLPLWQALTNIRKQFELFGSEYRI